MPDGSTLTRLRITEPTGIERRRHVVLGGVPIRRGMLAKGGWFELVSDHAAPFTVEGTPAAFWPDGSIKWLHLCGAIDLPAGTESPFILRALTNESYADAPSIPSLSVRNENNIFTIENGTIAVRVSADSSDLLRVARGPTIDGPPLLAAPGLNASLCMANPDLSRRTPIACSFDSAPPQIVVQTANRVVARLAGKFVENERVVGELILFVEVLRESPQLRLQPVFIYLGDPDRDLVASLTLTAHSVFHGENTRYSLANERGRGCRDVVQPVPPDPKYPLNPNKPRPPHEGGPRFPWARVVQSGASFYHSDKRTQAGSSWLKIAEGQRSKGWCHLADQTGGVTAGMRYFWQEYPRSLTLNADRGTIDFGLVPAECEPLDYRRYSPTIWGPPVYETSQGPFSAQSHGATGTAKSSELMLHFHAPGEDDAAEHGAHFAMPARIITPPEDLIDTGVIGEVNSKPAAGFESLEQNLDELTSFLVRERDVRGWYGLLNFGDVMLAYYSDKDRWAYDDGGFAWVNTEQLPDLGLWLAALRKGRADWLEAAIEMTRHNRDVDTYHRGELRGTGTRHGVNHFSDTDKEWRVTMPLVRRLHHYLTADSWTREVILETIRVYQSYDRTTRLAPSMTSAFIGLMTKHELTHDPADETPVRHMLDLLAGAVRDDGHFKQSIHANLATGIGEPIEDGKTLMGTYFFLLSFGGQHGLCEAAQTYAHQPMLDALVRFARLVASKNWPADALHPPTPSAALVALALAYRITGEAVFKQAIVDAITGVTPFKLEESGGDGPLDEPRHQVVASQLRRNKLTCMIGTQLHTLPYGLAAL